MYNAKMFLYSIFIGNHNITCEWHYDHLYTHDTVNESVYRLSWYL